MPYCIPFEGEIRSSTLVCQRQELEALPRFQAALKLLEPLEAGEDHRVLSAVLRLRLWHKIEDGLRGACGPRHVAIAPGGRM